MAARGDTFVARTEALLVEAVILSELAKRDHLTVDDLALKVRAAVPASGAIDDGSVTVRLGGLEAGGLVEAHEGRYRLTDAGFRDLRRAGALFSRAAPALVGAGAPPAAGGARAV